MRILIADDNLEIRSALRLLIEQEPGMTVITEAVDMPTLLASAAATQPDVVLIDLDLPGRITGDGNLVNALRDVASQAAVVAMGCCAEEQSKALGLGADSFVSKGDEPSKLLAVLRRYFDDGSKGGNG
jgi:DNA-binding NarL/FixJ family response regulator